MPSCKALCSAFCCKSSSNRSPWCLYWPVKASCLSRMVHPAFRMTCLYGIPCNGTVPCASFLSVLTSEGRCAVSNFEAVCLVCSVLRNSAASCFEAAPFVYHDGALLRHGCIIATTGIAKPLASCMPSCLEVNAATSCLAACLHAAALGLIN